MRSILKIVDRAAKIREDSEHISMNDSPKALRIDDASDLESVILTPRLTQNAQRLPNHHEENDALIALAKEMVASPDSILQKLAEKALKLCDAGSSGVSLLEPDGARFYWPAVTGALAPHIGEGTPRDFGPCGTVLDRNSPQLMSRPERHFTYLEAITPRIEQVLLVPFYMDGKAVGTIWVVNHDTARSFDAEDLRVMTNLATFAAAAFQILTTQAKLRETLTVHQDLMAKQSRLVTQRTAQLASSNESLADEVLSRAQAEKKVSELSGQLLNLQDEERRRIARDLHDTTGHL
jgi:GAF domain-containing protein